MAWTTPFTAATNMQMTAALYNQNIRDNLRLTAPGIAGTTGGKIIMSGGTNALALGEVLFDEVLTSQGYSGGTTYGDLTTPGPSVTGTITGQKAMVWISASMAHSASDSQAAASVEISGATSTPASNSKVCITLDAIPTGNSMQYMACYLYDPLSKGETTFTMKYRTGGSGTATFATRRIMVWCL